jgi:hypothetical protein
MKFILPSILILTICVSAFSIDSVFASLDNEVGNQNEEIEIKLYEKVERNDDTQLLHIILQLLENKNIDETTKQQLLTIAQKLDAKLVPLPTTHHLAEMNKLLKENEKLIAAYYNDQEFSQWFETELVGFGIDAREELLFLDIEPKSANQTNALKYKAKIESIINSTTNYEFRQIERPQMTGCINLVSNCDPLEGGVKIGISGGSDCSVGFKATNGTDEGFITAGHCGEIEDDVLAPEYPWDKIGEVTIDALTDSTVYTYCDCLFVNMTENVSVDDMIFSDIEIDGLGEISTGQTVTMKGYHSNTITGEINANSYSIVIDGVIQLDQFRIDSAPLTGDSGGPVYRTVEGTPKILGFISAVQDGEYTIASKAKHLAWMLPNVELDFD